MTTRPDGPADTRMMGIVHEALRRDLRRAHVTLSSGSPPPLRQQQAIARHLTWMMGFLHYHHRSEDEGLYPLVRFHSSWLKQLVHRPLARYSSPQRTRRPTSRTPDV